MSIRTKIEPIEDWVKLTVDETLSPAARSEAIADFARERIADAEQANKTVLGRVPRVEVFVDGRFGAALDTVKPDHGVIVAEFDLVTDVMRWIGDTLRDRSPVVSGAYRDAHTLFADGREVPLGAVIPYAEEYVFLNPLPYARKIEIGKTKSGRNFVVQVPNRIYERTAKDAKSRFGNIAKIRFSYRAPIGGRILNYQSAGTARAALSRRGGLERTSRVPAITLKLR